MKAYMCHWCGRIYLHKHPFICECHSNAFFKEYETSEDEIRELRDKGAKIIDGRKIEEVVI